MTFIYCTRKYKNSFSLLTLIISRFLFLMSLVFKHGRAYIFKFMKLDCKKPLYYIIPFEKNQESELLVENFVNINLHHMIIYPLHANQTLAKLCVSDFAWSVIFIQGLIEQKHMQAFFILS